MEWITKIFEALKLPLKYIWLFSIISAFLLFSSKDLLKYFSLLDFRDDFRFYISLTFIVSTSLLIIEGVSFSIKKIRKIFGYKKYREKVIENLSSLDPYEKAVLREFFIQAKNTLKLPYDHPIISNLIKKGLLKIVGNIAENSLAGMLIPMEINKEFKDLITSENIDLPIIENDRLTKEQEEFLINNRPDFLPEIEHHERLFHRGWWR